LGTQMGRKRCQPAKDCDSLIREIAYQSKPVGLTRVGFQ
jgi:hypothetical protein